MARRRLTPAQPAYLVPGTAAAGSPGSAPTSAPTSPPTPPAAAPLAARDMPPIARVAGDAAGTLAAQQLAEELRAAKDEGRMVVEVPLADVAPGYLLRDRIALDREELEALKESIRRHGQRVPPRSRPWRPARPAVPSAAPRRPMAGG